MIAHPFKMVLMDWLKDMKKNGNLTQIAVFSALLALLSCNGHYSHSVSIGDAKHKETDTAETVPVYLTLDSATLNNRHLTYKASDYFYKAGDSLKWINDTALKDWGRKPESEHAYIWYLIPVNVDTDLLNTPVCLDYSYNGAFEVYLDGKMVYRNGDLKKQKSDDDIKDEEKYFYLSFTRAHNYLIIRTANLTGSSMFRYHGFFKFTMYPYSVKIKDLQTDAESTDISDAISTALSIFYFAFFFLYLSLFFSDKKAKVNLYFALLCFFIFIDFLLSANFIDFHNPELNSAKDLVFDIILAFLSYIFLCFLHQLVFGRLSKYLKWLLIACILLSAVLLIKPLNTIYSRIIYAVGVFIIGTFSTIDGIRVIIIGLKNKTRGIKPIIRGIYISMILSVVSLIITVVSDSGDVGFFSWALSLSVIPISVAITLVNNHAKTSKLLSIELEHVKSLSAMTISQQREKQQILESQKEKLEEQVTLRTAEIIKQKNEVERQKELVEIKNKDILDSINYAKRLQDAILPPVSLIQSYFPDSFVLYKPKDIVAGDFYWLAHLNPSPFRSQAVGNADEVTLLAACDCTGHGVPGALVSVVCSNALNQAVKEFKLTDPGKILDKVRDLVLETFEKSENDVQDGMDVSLCCFNPSKMEIEWSGAYNPLWYVSDGIIKEIIADKQPIGKYDTPAPFKTNRIKLKKGDCFYLFTDGYADQFGGPKGKKFKYQQLEDLLVEHSSEPMAVQKQRLNDKLEDWKGELEQIDDILIIGIRV